MPVQQTRLARAQNRVSAPRISDEDLLIFDSPGVVADMPSTISNLAQRRRLAQTVVYSFAVKKNAT
jgi:hypothetical protein